MGRLVIKNIGAIKSIDIELNSINVLIGAQSSGKSTVSKILCHCMWVEKSAYFNVDYLKEKYENSTIFYDSLIDFHRLDGYFHKTASIKYYGDYINITYTHSSQKTAIKPIKSSGYLYPKIGYIPSERNLVATISNFEKYNDSKDSIAYFGYDWSDAKNEIPTMTLTKILDRDVSYVNKNGKDYIKDGKSEILLKGASSGMLSVVPLYLTVSYLYKYVYTKPKAMTSLQRNIIFEITKDLNELALTTNPQNSIREDLYNRIVNIASRLGVEGVKGHKEKDINIFDVALEVNKKLSDVFDYKYTQLFIEEPEQNLFPKAQMRFLYELLELIINPKRENRAVITTHSPYILYALNNCMMGGFVKDNIAKEELKELESSGAYIDPKNVSVFKVENGEMSIIQNEDNLIGENYFDSVMKEVMDDYYLLLEYYGEDE